MKWSEVVPMRRPRITVQHCVVNAATSQYGSHPTSNLIGVDYYRSYPLDAEFPRTVPTLDVFVRFFLHRPRPTVIAVQTLWLNDDGSDRERVNEFLYEVPFRSEEVVYDRVFRLANVLLPGEGDYAVRVCHPRRRTRGPDGCRILATEFFRVIRS